VYAINNNDLETVKNVLNNGLDVNIPIFKMFSNEIYHNEADKYYNRTALTHVCLLKKRRFDIGSHNRLEYDKAYGKPSKYENSDLLILKELIKAGADVDMQESNGSTALHYAVDECNNLLSKELIKAGADVNIQDDNGNIPLMKCVLPKYPNWSKSEIATILINANSDFNIKNSNDENFKDFFEDTYFFSKRTHDYILDNCPNLSAYYTSIKYNL